MDQYDDVEQRAFSTMPPNPILTIMMLNTEICIRLERRSYAISSARYVVDYTNKGFPVYGTASKEAKPWSSS
ncbi:hypothetical protein TNCV_1357101 [Trichonephila clavipes]|uniref:Uncharacterized protein n=1 Tax=Trichonephila clavipes TaxID=2585209 RepID=A0A8X6VI95_TRICX|nr:hypothetical protein TNCV_1357101 [Trichonephila clavipes]